LKLVYIATEVTKMVNNETIVYINTKVTTMSLVKLFYIATEVIESVIIESCLLYYRSNTTKSVIIETGLHYYSVKKILHYITLLQYIKNI